MIESKTCLLPMITEQSTFLLRMYRHYTRRVLPYAGGILEQPNYFIEAMEHIAARENELRAEQAERQRDDLRRHGINLGGAHD